MKKTFFTKLIILVLCGIMAISLFACNGGKTEVTTEAPTQEPTEAPTQEPTEAPVVETTEAAADETTEAAADETTEAAADETTEAPAVESTEAAADETTEAAADETTEAPAVETTEAPVVETTEAPVDETTEAPEEETTEEPAPTVCENNACEVKLSTAGGVKYTCTVCGTVYEQNTGEKVNFYSAPGQALNNWAAGYAGNSTANWAHVLMVEEGKVFERIKLGDGASFKFDNGTSAEVRRFPATSKIEGGSGRYLVMRVRANDINFNIRLILNSDTSSEGSNADLKATTTNSIGRADPFKDGQWVTYVIDLKTAALPLYPTEDANVKKIAIGLDMPGFVATENSSLDVAYVAICDDWSEIDSIVEEETVMLSGWRNDDAWKEVATTDGKMPETEITVDTKGDDADKVIYQKTGNELRVYIRSPYTDKYTMYKFAYSKNNSTAYEGWMIYCVAICDTDLNILYYASREKATDLEGALQEYNTAYQEKTGSNLAGDFIGGFHGDEKYRTVKITVDGAELDMTKDYALAACESVVTVVESDVYRWDTTETVFDRTKTISWSEAGMEITNSYKTVAPITIFRPAVGMLVVYRDDSGYNELVTKHWDNISEKWIDIVWPEKPSGNHHQDNMTYAKLDGELICASLEIKDFGVNGVQTLSKGWFNYDSWYAGNQRAKIYIDIFRLKELKVGDIMHCTAVHTVFAKGEGMDTEPEETPDVTPEETPDGSCAHEYKREKVGDDWVISCTKCDYKYEYGLTLSAAQRIYNPYELGAYSNMGTTVVHTDSNFDADGPEYMRITNITATSSQMVLNSTSTGERYVVIKFRIGKNGLGQTTLQFYAPSNLASGQNYGHAGFAVAATEDNEWHTVVVDLAARVAEGGYNADAEGKYDLKSLYLRPYGNKQAAAIESKNAYVDIAYIAICDEFSDVSALVGEETYEWSVSNSENEIRNTETHEAVK